MKYIIEMRSEFFQKISRRKNDFLQLLKEASEDKEKEKELSTRFGITFIMQGTGHEKVVVNVDGEPIFRR